MFVKSTRFKQVCQLLLSLIVETALNTTVANNAHQKKDGYRFVVDNSGEVTQFDWYNARISLDFKVVWLMVVTLQWQIIMEL